MYVSMRLRAVRVGDRDWAVWGEMARSQGLSRSAWLRRAARYQWERERALALLEEDKRA